jgi:hypothetical protein
VPERQVNRQSELITFNMNWQCLANRANNHQADRTRGRAWPLREYRHFPYFKDCITITLKPSD